MRREEYKIIRTVLQKNMGWYWPFLLAKSLVRSRSIYKGTSWAKQDENGEEALFAKRLCLTSALYLELQKKFEKEMAFEIMRKITVPIGCKEQLRNTKSLNVSDREPTEQLLSFYGFMGIGGVGRFVNSSNSGTC